MRAPWITQDEPYMDYGDWERWMGEQLDRPCPFGQEAEYCPCMDCATFRWWDGFESLERTGLYVLMARAFNAP